MKEEQLERWQNYFPLLRITRTLNCHLNHLSIFFRRKILFNFVQIHLKNPMYAAERGGSLAFIIWFWLSSSKSV